MATEIIMPKNGMDMTEGVIIRWFKHVGDQVHEGEPLMEIETDKITMESEAPASGILLNRLFEEGDVVPVLTVLGYIGQAGEVPAPLPQEDQAQVKTDRTLLETRKTIHDYDVAVIGGGPAGYVAAIKAAQMGGKVILFEKEKLGGTCLNRGCIPMKAYLKTARLLAEIRGASERGVVLETPALLDMIKVVKHKDRVVRTLVTGVSGLLKSNNVELVPETAELKSATEILAGDGRHYEADRIILCGGSRPGKLPLPGSDHPAVISSDDIFALQEIPLELCIVGAGVVGSEVASAFAAFGSRVTLVDILDRPLAHMDDAISQEIAKALQSEGIELLMGTSVEAIEDDGGRPVLVTDQGRITCDRVLLAVGREPDMTCLGALDGEIQQKDGFVQVNDKMETNIKGIYAAGDITGGLMLAHAASKMGECAAASAMGQPLDCDLTYTPQGFYGILEASSVGMTEKEAATSYGSALAIGTFPIRANGRSLASGAKEGFVKVLVDKNYGQILGVHIVGQEAVEMIAEPAALMAMEVTAHEVADSIIHSHPTYYEAFMEACADALGRSIHLPAKKQ